MIALLITATALMTATPLTTCQLTQGNSCCSDCEARQNLCQSKSDSLSEALDCLGYHKKCADKCTSKETDNLTKTKTSTPVTNKTE